MGSRIFQRPQHPLFVVADQWNDGSALRALQPGHSFDAFPAGGSTVNVVSGKNQGIDRSQLWLELFQKIVERGDVAVKIANSNCSHGSRTHGAGTGSFSSSNLIVTMLVWRWPGAATPEQLYGTENLVCWSACYGGNVRH